MGGCSDAGFWSGREQTAKRSLGSPGSGLLGKERETHVENHICDPITRSRPQAGLGLEYSFKNWSKPESLCRSTESPRASMQIDTCKAVHCRAVDNSENLGNS